MGDVNEMIDQEVASRLCVIHEMVREELVALESVCESPIEIMMGARLLLLDKPYGYWAPCNRLWPYGSHNEGPGGGLRLHDFDVAIIPQWKARKYRVDFLVLYGVPRPSGELAALKFVVECDGHAFHEKTKEQAARDKARDRFFTSRGFFVFRYTGGEIMKNGDDLLADLEGAMMRGAEEIFRATTVSKNLMEET